MGCVVNKPLPEPVTDLKQTYVYTSPNVSTFGLALTLPKNADGVKILYRNSPQLQKPAYGDPNNYPNEFPPIPLPQEVDGRNGVAVYEFEKNGQQVGGAGLTLPPFQETYKHVVYISYRAISYNSNGYNTDDVEGSVMRAYKAIKNVSL